MASKTIRISEDVYNRLVAHKRGDESVNDAPDRLLHDVDADWQTHVGFLTPDEADDLEAEVDRGLADFDQSIDDFGNAVDDGADDPH